MTLCVLSTSIDAASSLSAVLTEQARAFLRWIKLDKFGANPLHPSPPQGNYPKECKYFLGPIHTTTWTKPKQWHTLANLSFAPKCFHIIMTLCALSTSLDAASNLSAVLTKQQGRSSTGLDWRSLERAPPLGGPYPKECNYFLGPFHTSAWTKREQWHLGQPFIHPKVLLHHRDIVCVLHFIRCRFKLVNSLNRTSKGIPPLEWRSLEPPPKANQNIFILYVEVATLVGCHNCMYYSPVIDALSPATNHPFVGSNLEWVTINILFPI
jgi:hypothetical protein